MQRREAVDEIVIIAAKLPMPALLHEVDVPSIVQAHLLGPFPEPLNALSPSAPEDIYDVMKILWCGSRWHLK